LIDVIQPETGQPVTQVLLDSNPATLLPQLPALEIARVKQLAIRYIFEHLPAGSHNYTFSIEAADSQEVLLITLGQAQRDLFDGQGRECAVEFYETIVAPAFFPEPSNGISTD
jgi:hypothetical protein